MRRSHATSWRLVPLLVLGIVLLAIAAWPDGFFRFDSLPPSFDRAAPFRAYLSEIEAWPTSESESGLEIQRRLARDPLHTSETLDIELRRLATLGATFGAGIRMLNELSLLTGETIELEARRDELIELPVRRIAELGDRGAAIHTVSAQNANRFPKRLSGAVARCIAAIERVDQELGAEFPRVSSDDLAVLTRLALRRADECPAVPDADALRALSDSFDAGRALEIATHLADAIDSELDTLLEVATDPALSVLRTLPEGDGIPRNLVFASECGAGLVLIGNLNSTVIPLEGVALAIDLGGDDRWHAGAHMGTTEFPSTRVRVLLDLSGRDKYEGSIEAPGAIRDGIALLLDAAGDDIYDAPTMGFAAVERGIAMSIDRQGDDRYSCAERGIAYAAQGAALLLDVTGDDSYRCERAGIGHADNDGLAAFVDQRGMDLYITDRSLGELGFSTVGSARSLSTHGAFACFLDGGGDDSYRLGRGAGGFATEAGFAVCVDAGGDDLYSAAAWCLGSARRGGHGWFRDYAGVDEYLAREFSLGSAAGGVGIFIDDAERDRVLSIDPSRGAVSDGGSSLFVDIGSTGRAGRADDRKTFKR